MNRLDALLQQKDNLLSIYFTAGYPSLNDTMKILEGLNNAGADFVEIGMPFSDPLADGPVIQRASLDALNNGISIKKMFEQIRDMRRSITIPVVLMGYINPIMHFGMENFVSKCQAVGVDGLILPDLPWDEYVEKYKAMMDNAGIRFIPLIAPQTPDDRIRHIDEECDGFIYMVASAGITGKINTSEDYRTKYFNRIRNLKLRNKTLIGFGITDNAGYKHACQHASGAIVGTAFIKHIQEKGASAESINSFISRLKG